MTSIWCDPLYAAGVGTFSVALPMAEAGMLDKTVTSVVVSYHRNVIVSPAANPWAVAVRGAPTVVAGGTSVMEPLTVKVADARLPLEPDPVIVWAPLDA